MRNWVSLSCPTEFPYQKFIMQSSIATSLGLTQIYKLHVCERLLAQNDGPILEAPKRLRGTNHLPSRVRDRPDRNRLAARFEPL
jgi:putative restriction endonuclease